MAQISNPFESINVRFDYVERLLTELGKRQTESVCQGPDEDKFISKEKVSEIYGVSHVTIWDWERKGILKSYRLGNLKRFKLSEVMAAPVPIKRTGAKGKETDPTSLIRVA